MGLFGKKKNPEEILAEGRAQYENGDLKKAFLTLHGLAGKGEPRACYYVGRIYLERKEKSLAQSFLTIAAKDGVPEAVQLLEKELGIRDYLPKETEPQPKAEEAPSVDDLLEELEETGQLIQDTKRELQQMKKKMGGLGEFSPPKPQAEPKDLPWLCISASPSPPCRPTGKSPSGYALASCTKRKPYGNVGLFMFGLSLRAGISFRRSANGKEKGGESPSC